MLARIQILCLVILKIISKGAQTMVETTFVHRQIKGEEARHGTNIRCGTNLPTLPVKLRSDIRGICFNFSLFFKISFQEIQKLNDPKIKKLKTFFMSF
jgi:hypothetical protein